MTTIIFKNSVSNYAVLLLKQAQGEQLITGPLSDCAVGDYLQVTGEWVTHPVHKRQFKVNSVVHLVPQTNDELLLFLSTGVISGIGPHFAKTLVNAFGNDLVSVLDDDPTRLLSVTGIGKKKLSAILSSWQLHRDQLSFLHQMLSVGIDITIAKRIWNVHYSNAFDVCQNTPYQLIQEVRGVDFLVADRIAGARHKGSDARLMAAVEDVFAVFFKTAHVWMPFDDFYDHMQQRVPCDHDALMAQLQHFIFCQTLVLVAEGNMKWVTLPQYSHGELAIMNGMDALMSAPTRVPIQADAAVDWVLPRLPTALSVDQAQALHGLCAEPVCMLHGGPGTGKTFLLKAFVDIVSKKTNRILCMAPTGKAAKRLGDQVGRRASTIHAMMELDEKNHALTPKALDVDVCIIDEMSMVDMMLFQDVLRMLPIGVRLVLVGDPNQLPSIGPGQVFGDMIHHSSIPSFKLSTNHRQITHQGITALASHILNRAPIDGPLGDDITIKHIESEAMLEAEITDVFLNKAMGEHGVTLDDIQLLIPIHKGQFGIANVNQRMAQSIRLPQFSHHQWAVGDRVIQCRNNYTKRVMNGDIGCITAIGSEAITIAFNGREMAFDSTDMLDIQLAYAVSIHKFQGSEAPVVILPIIKQWGFFMSTDVLYTAVTRAKTHLYVIGDMVAFNKMIELGKSTNRLTRLFRS
ncbi:MAG: AAA family ATPase [Candidatus Margulisbacteria bacterium]|nr:AAA family ATPase [Candidatus Margulisiibacteriota bacterium]